MNAWAPPLSPSSLTLNCYSFSLQKCKLKAEQRRAHRWQSCFLSFWGAPCSVLDITILGYGVDGESPEKSYQSSLGSTACKDGWSKQELLSLEKKWLDGNVSASKKNERNETKMERISCSTYSTIYLSFKGRKNKKKKKTRQKYINTGIDCLREGRIPESIPTGKKSTFQEGCFGVE